MAFSELEKHNKMLIQDGINDIHTTWIGKIYDVDNTKRKASVKFLQKAIRSLKDDVIQTTPEDLTDVPLLPVFSGDSFEIYVPYSNDDKVFINIFERPYIEAFQSNEISEQQSFGRTEMGFAVVIRAIPSDIVSGKQKNNDKIVINNKKNGTNVILGNSIEITGDTIITGNLKITGDVTIKGKLKVSEIDTESGIKQGRYLEIQSVSRCILTILSLE